MTGWFTPPGFRPAPPPEGGNDPVPGGWATRIDLASLLALRNAALGLSMDPVRARSGQSGATLSLFKGRGIEFAESRPYQAGDEVRHMDWRVTARTGKPYTKIFHEDRERATLVWIDLCPAMFFATRGMFKAVAAARGAALVAWGAALQGNRLGGLLFTDREHREVRPTRGDHGVLRLLGLLAAAGPTDQPSPSTTEQAMEESLVRLRRVTQPGSRLFLFGDFARLGDREKVHLAQLARRNDVILVFIYDLLERMLPPPGWYPVSDGEHRFLLDSHSPDQRRRYQERFQQRLAALARFCQQHGLLLLSCATGEDIVALLQRALGMPLTTLRRAGHGIPHPRL
ncbi:MAG: DUF58 domain-containing protein [Magnetococcus sp. DMHC-8]